MRRWLNKNLSRIFLTGLLLGFLFGCDMDQTFIFFPESRLAATPADFGLPYEEVSFLAEDGTALHGWFVPGEEGAPAILFFHGNAGNISHRIHNLRLFRERLGVSVFIFDYRGYGRSEGKPSEEGTYADARGALAWLQEKGWEPERIIYFGRSLGAGVATQLALEAPPAGLVLETPFPSIAAMGRKHYPLLYAVLGRSVRSRYDTLEKIGEISAPLLVIQGSADSIVPPEMARQIFEAAGEPKRFHLIPGAGHNDTLDHGVEDYWGVWQDFVTDVLGEKMPHPSSR
jgi:uncharacterized protein